MDNITTHANNYTSTQPCDAQNSEMLYQFLLSSLVTEFKTKILLHQAEFMLNNEQVRACLFKKIMQLSYVDTMAAASQICETLMEVHLKLPTINHNIIKFNDWV